LPDRGFQIAGWVLFIISALGFIVSSLRSGDFFGLIGGIFFLIACIVFLIPIFRRPEVLPDRSGNGSLP
jgi:hypothetical protein